jgi:hypothetical protein
MATASMKTELVAQSDWAWGRTRSRLEGLTDEELFWEPYPGCWSLRQLRGGTWISDWIGTEPDVPPLTTIVWRIVHLIGLYGAARNSEWVAVRVESAALESWDVTPTSAVEALATLEQAHDRWRQVLLATDDDTLGLALGPIGGQYSESSRAAFLIHMLDEIVHHAAEIGLMRDLFRAASGRIHADPLVARLMTGDLSAFEAARGREDLVGELAAVGRWDLVEEALIRGCTPDGPPPTALHRAATMAMPSIIDQLLAAGASTAVRDPQFNATPSQWAEFFGHRDLARRLADPSGEDGG